MSVLEFAESIYDWDAWTRQIARDHKDGNLAAFIAEAQHEHAVGGRQPFRRLYRLEMQRRTSPVAGAVAAFVRLVQLYRVLV